jgi:flagellar biosynthesis protein FliQ
MTPEFAVELMKALLVQAVALGAPILLTAMAVGLSVSLVQAVTSIQEQTLTFVPKVLAVVTTVVILLPWTLRTATEFAAQVIGRIPQMAQ